MLTKTRAWHTCRGVVVLTIRGLAWGGEIGDRTSQITNYKLQITNYKLQITNYKLQITDHRSQITDHRLQITDYRLQEWDWGAVSKWGVMVEVWVERFGRAVVGFAPRKTQPTLLRRQSFKCGFEHATGFRGSRRRQPQPPTFISESAYYCGEIVILRAFRALRRRLRWSRWAVSV
jgi:hypothetical protein